ncbi:extensin family protein [Rhizobium sp. ICMP 5592]|uniref:extensin-like domain-containing protein n=1 Tax=Rhizobium sp. ICMP 5592 TaxID=2292445 RepID=UPI0012954AB8|nr:extensin family protein [Rhizobium sp. ICMP 5592]MQB42376.1 extensin [Rhizobium sp. ICMP 5592]
MLFRIISATTAIIVLTAASLPQTGPLPQQKSDLEQIQPSAEPPTPMAKPAVPEIQPTTGEMQGPPKPPPTIAAESEEEHQTCLTQLTAIGATFKDIPRIDDGNGCGIDKPIALTESLPGIRMKPEGTMRCEIALALAHWMKESVIPSAAALKDNGRIVTINQASTYICRLRNNAATGKISEHARGNAVDIAGFTFENGKTIGIEPRREDPTLTGAFQRTASASACLYFSTVLDPESDAAHETHFHLDVLKRSGGFRYCH